MATQVYAPLSPARSECVYEPASPAHSTQTLSVEDILCNIRKKNWVVKKREKTIRPIYNWRSYLKSLLYEEKRKLHELEDMYTKKSEQVALYFFKEKRRFRPDQKAFFAWAKVPQTTNFVEIQRKLLGNFKEKINKQNEMIEKVHEQIVTYYQHHNKIDNRKMVLGKVFKSWKDDCVTVKPPIDVPKDPFHKIDGVAPLEPIYTKYFQNFMFPPTEEYAAALLEFGYPQWVIDRMLKKPRKFTEINLSEIMGELFAASEKKKKKKGPVKLK